MNKFLIKTLVFTILFFLFDKAFYPFIFLAPSLEVDNRLEKVINGEINKDIIVIGSSRGARNIIAGQIEDSLSLSSYNLSYPGSDIEFHEFLLRSLLQFNEKPKLVLLVMDVDDPAEFFPNESIKFRLDRLYPLARYKYVNNELIARGEKTFLSNIMVLARINKRNFDLRKKYFSVLDTIIDCGSMPIFSQMENLSSHYDTSIMQYQIQNESEEKISAFLKFQDLCIQNEIKLFLMFPPNFKSYNYNFEKRLIKLTSEKVDYFVYDTLNPVYKDVSFFYDASHLRTHGAIIFTSEIIKYLKSNI